MTEQITLFGERTARPSQAPPEPTVVLKPIEGVVSRQLAERGEWRLLLVEVDGAQQKWSGEMHRPPDGTTVRATGRFEQDRRGPGQILRVDSLLDVVPTHEIGLIEFIAHLGVPGVKKGLAKKIVKRFGLETVAILDASPERIAEVLGKKGQKKAADIAAEWAKKRALAATTMFLLEKGATPGMARKIVNRFEERARWIVENDPYRLTEIDGIGFAKADDLAVKIGLPRESIQRAQAAILHSLMVETYERGHTYTPVEDLARAATELIEVASHRIDEAMADLHAAGTRVVFTETDGGRVASMPRIARAEARLVRRISALISATPKTWPAPALTGGISKPLPELVEQAIASFEQDTKMTLAAAQREAVRLAAQHNVIVLTGGPGVGKCLGRGTPVLMFDGSIKPVEDVANGDLVMGPDSQPRRVSGTTRGVGPLYEIRPIKGTPWVCNDAHVLTLVRSGTDEVRDISLPEYLALGRGAKWRVKGKLFKVGVDFPDRDVPMDPYLVGLWLGDGTRGQAGITTAEPEVLDAMDSAATACGYRLHVAWQPGCIHARFTHGRVGARNPNTFKDGFRAFVSSDGGKFIPSIYKVNSREKRLALLAGLVDTDGFTVHKCIEIATKWREMADDIAFLARSLGICVTVAQKYVQLEGWDAPRLYHRLVLSGNLDEIPSRVPRRKVEARLQIKDALRTGFDVVPIGQGEYFGFQLDGDGRFLLGDFTVTHNTAVTQAILELFKLGNIPTVLCAPTGRAAKRMNEATGAAAATIHRTLSYDPQTKGFLHNEERPIHCGAVIVDEVSMLELSLAGDIFGAIPDGARVVIIGDVDQLPSVGPGAVLRDLIECGRIPTVRLTQIFRQAKGSEISVQAQRVNAGQMPQGQPGPEGEFFVIRRDDGESAAEAVLDMVTKRIPERFGIAPKDVFVLAPMYRGRAGIDALNRMLQDALNPLDAVNGIQVVRGKEPDLTRFRVGDRVLQTKNNAELDVFNGDLGIITSITVEPDEKGKDRNVVNVAFDGGRVVAYPEGKPLDAITLAYAMSVHRSQGSTLPAVVVVMLGEHYVMLSRKLLYTAITRAKHLAVLVSSPKAMGQAVSEARREERRTLLAEKMRRMCDAR